ncbi:Calcineurin subunit B [Clonorchis sinensis]|uniref:Protein phosphatase 3 regulatory subunit n=2 Tax=Clonorchis sinensis TaxID=79923 RepID=G7YK80_CLOSI|nr:Calcineurin subunit B [Clonorchis sinensis]GAA53362.1 protein phosphatase 3 regulatory subunit [Clonorchis sinensis]
MTQKFLDKASLEKRFRELDVDGSGWLSKEEYTAEVERLGYPASLAKRFMDMFDKDNDGQVTMAEFVSSLMNVQRIEGSKRDQS